MSTLVTSAVAIGADNPKNITDEDNAGNITFDYQPNGSGENTLWSPLTVTFSHEIAANPSESRELINNRSSMRLQYSNNFWRYFYGRIDTRGTLYLADDHRAEAEKKNILFDSATRELYLEVSRGSHSARLGRQIVVWGESQLGIVTDVISPRDFSELFFITLEESRLGQNIIAYDNFSQVGTWNVFAVPNPRFNETPDEGTAYDTDPFAGRAVVDNNLNRPTEYGIRWKKTVGNNDFRLMAAHLVANDPVFRATGTTASGLLKINRESQQYDMAGVAFNYSVGPWLVAGELAGKSALAFNTRGFDVVERDVVDSSLRVQRSLGKGGSHRVGFEVSSRRVLNWRNDLLSTPRNSYSLGLTWNNTYLNDTLSVNVISEYDKPYTAIRHSLFITYNIDDNLSIDLNSFYVRVDDTRNELFPFRGQNNTVLRLNYQF